MNGLFQNKITLVAGNSPYVIASVIHTFLTEGATVIFPAKSASEIIALKTSLSGIDCDKLITLITDYPDYYRSFNIAETTMEQFAKIDFAIICFDPPYSSAAITGTNIRDWEKMIDQNLTTYFIGCRIAFHLMKNNAQAMLISICCESNPAAPTHSDLAELSFIMQKEMAVMFSKRFKKKHIGFYHLILSDLESMQSHRTISPSLTKTESPALNNLGEYISGLYKNEVENREILFHFL